eukprot:Phypoly_transcript_19488.p1 GENE.Phypoly_transcript_19488~~Phypoly_transcript_19488.p1  ORF type:complete len:109 (+),score=26.69 Phypoly_transcript_19488:146-472(+)
MVYLYPPQTAPHTLTLPHPQTAKKDKDKERDKARTPPKPSQVSPTMTRRGNPLPSPSLSCVSPHRPPLPHKPVVPIIFQEIMQEDMRGPLMEESICLRIISIARHDLV